MMVQNVFKLCECLMGRLIKGLEQLGKMRGSIYTFGGKVMLSLQVKVMIITVFKGT